MRDDEWRTWLNTAMGQTIAAELGLVRMVLRRLAYDLNDPALAKEPEEMRRLSLLIFNGARTAARLYKQQNHPQDELQGWLSDVLVALAKDYELDL